MTDLKPCAEAAIISDAEIIRVHGYANFGGMSPREVVNDGVRKTAVGYHCGHTQLCILREHGLVTKPRPGSYDVSLTKKGKAYGRAIYFNRRPHPTAPDDTGEFRDWRCEHCQCRTYARVDAWIDGRWQPGPQVRCVECKVVTDWPTSLSKGEQGEAVAWRWRQLHHEIDGPITGWFYAGERPEKAGRHRWEVQPLFAAPPSLPGRVNAGPVETIDEAARRLFAEQYPERDYDAIQDRVKITWMRSAWDKRLGHKPEGEG